MKRPSSSVCSMEGRGMPANVFIVETLDPDDEGNGRCEGVVISQILRLHGKEPVYRYVRTRKQFKRAIKEFGESKCRYLHISSHANKKRMITTNGDKISFRELAIILKKIIRGKRLFLSACLMTNDDLASEIFGKTRCLSILGPTGKVKFTVSAVLWPALYHLMFSALDDGMRNVELKKNSKSLAKLFEEEMRLYIRSKGKNSTYREYTYAGK